ncbi:hypothetical protein [Rhodococcus sp. IEGM 1343]|uniref:hypothetical protein n=1 Tax=Rhodococcus sp. IEGM 1343 TaxID=3082224 RepID=UPI003989B8B0
MIGRNVDLRNGVTIGHKTPGTHPPVIGHGVEIGANAVVIGDIFVADNSKIGAGAVISKSCGPNSVMVGNPARNIGARADLSE